MNTSASYFAVAVIGASVVTLAQGPPGWLNGRQHEFSTWQASHPAVEMRLPALKEKTAALIAAYVPAATSDEKYADLKAQSATLSAAQRTEADRYFASAYQFYELEDYFSAREFFDLGLAIDPAHVKAILHRGEIYRRSA